MLVLSVAGCKTPERATQSHDINIVAGVRVFGPHKYWTEAKVIALKAAVAAVDDTYPILSIKFIDSNTAEVTTGIVRGPLNGEGRDFKFLLKDGKWITDRFSRMIWVS
jgi:hypothetical protein